VKSGTTAIVFSSRFEQASPFVRRLRRRYRL
jgi:hypothetical protein